jgi:hypothetical protein
MNSIELIANRDRAKAAGAKLRVFNWNRAAEILMQRVPDEADAGLSGDLFWTSDTIWQEGGPRTECSTYLASIHATPVLVIDGEEIPCWILAEDSPGWNAETKWPDSALDIVSKWKGSPAFARVHTKSRLTASPPRARVYP